MLDEEQKWSSQGGRKPRVLVIAEAANPDWASVPLIGWEIASALRTVADVHLVTQIRNREAILRQGWREGEQFTAIDNDNFVKPLLQLASILRGGEQKGWTTLSAAYSIAYYTFEKEVWRLFAERLRQHEFDLVHRVTPLSPACQSPLAKKLSKASVPFVIGPLNGGIPWPKGFGHRQIAEREWLSYIRPIYKLLPAYKSTRTESRAIIVGSRFTEQDMPAAVRSKCIYIPENGINFDVFNKRRLFAPRLPLKGCFVGRLVPYKGADLLIRAGYSFLKSGQLSLEIVGDGPQRDLITKQIVSEGLEGCVRCHGWVSHSRVQDIVSECDFLALPSIREFGGAVVLEAMSLGVIPIVADYGGPGELVSDESGIRVSFQDEESLVDGFAAAFEKVIQSPDLLVKMGQAAINEVELKYDWNKKAFQFSMIYKAVLSGAVDFSDLGVRNTASKHSGANEP